MLNGDSIQGLANDATNRYIELGNAANGALGTSGGWMFAVFRSDGFTSQTSSINVLASKGILVNGAQSGPGIAVTTANKLAFIAGGSSITSAACISNAVVNDGQWHAVVGSRPATTLQMWLDGTKQTGTDTGTLAGTASHQWRVLHDGDTTPATNREFNGAIALLAMGTGVLPDALAAKLSRNPQSIFTHDRIRLYFGAGGGTTTTITESVSARLKARGSETSAPIRTETVVARSRARGTATVTAIKVEAVVARRKARATDSTAAIRTEAAVGRVKARSTTTVVHIDAGAVVQPVAGRRRVSASVAATSIRTEVVVARRQARGSDTVTLTRTESVAARRKVRGAVTAAPVVAGMITEAVAGRLRARGSSTTTTTRIEAVATRRKARGSAVINGIRAALAAGRARLRAAVAGAPYVAPTLPLEVPEPTRTLNAQESRLGASPIAADPRRLGATPTRKAPPRLG